MFCIKTLSRKREIERERGGRARRERE